MDMHIVIGESTTSGAGLMVLESALQMGINVTFITKDINKYQSHDYNGVLAKVGQINGINTQSYRELLSAVSELHARRRVDGILSLTDSAIDATSQVA